MATTNVLDVTSLAVEFDTHLGLVEAVSDVTLSIEANQTVAVVGESGSGKSVTALSIMGLLENGRISRGRVRLGGTEIQALRERQLRELRGAQMAMIFQDPMTCLDPLYTVGDQIVEALRLHKSISRKRAAQRAVELLEEVGLDRAAERARAYPHQLSGGQRQRVMIAIALACEPKLLVADEPTTALDVTVQAQILRLLKRLQADHSTAVLLITHDMAVVAQMADDVVVMYAGQVVERGSVSDVLERPQHPYTRALLAALPHADIDPDTPLADIRGTVPPLTSMPKGCRFAPRCDFATEQCATVPPVVEGPAGSLVRCWLAVPSTAIEMRVASRDVADSPQVVGA